MNKNIEVINENLYAVNSAYIKMGYIQEFVPLSENVTDGNPYVSLTDDGILILKKESEFYPILKKLLLRIMEHSDEQLNFAMDKMRKVSEPDAYEEMYLNVLEWEMKRRCVKAEYLSSQPKPTFKDKIIMWLRKKVKEWQVFRQELN